MTKSQNWKPFDFMGIGMGNAITLHLIRLICSLSTCVLEHAIPGIRDNRGIPEIPHLLGADMDSVNDELRLNSDHYLWIEGHTQGQEHWQYELMHHLLWTTAKSCDLPFQKMKRCSTSRQLKRRSEWLCPWISPGPWLSYVGWKKSSPTSQ